MRGTETQYLYLHECILDYQAQWNKEKVKQQQRKGTFLFLKADDDWATNGGVRRYLLKRRVYGKTSG